MALKTEITINLIALDEDQRDELLQILMNNVSYTSDEDNEEAAATLSAYIEECGKYNQEEEE